jgi:hypothetical protein
MPDSSVPASPLLEEGPLTTLQQDLVNILLNIGGPLFALLDATRDPLRILGMLKSAGEEYQSLYEGVPGKMLQAHAPYLVRLSGASRLLETLVARGWGKHWGIFVVSAADFKTVRKHFRTFLMVRSPEGKQLYFRYYDPRVLRVYLPTCNPAETSFVFGPVAAYLCEGEAPDMLLVFQPGEAYPRHEAVKLSGTFEEATDNPAGAVSQDVAFLRATLSD